MKNFPFPKKIRKRDGRVVDFDPRRISEAVFKAFEAVGEPDRKAAEELVERVVEKISKHHKPSSKIIPSIEEVQDIVEETLIERGYAKIAKAYILYRERRAEIRREKQKILDKEEIDEVDKRFDLNALRVLRSRYLRKDDEGRVIESPKEMFTRVALHVALPEVIYSNLVSRSRRGLSKAAANEGPITKEKAETLEGELSIGKYRLNRFHVYALNKLFLRFQKEGRLKISWPKLVQMLRQNRFKFAEEMVDSFYDLMVSRRFLPNTPALANFGNYLGMGSACFVLDIEDSIDSIMDTLKNASVIFKAGGGLGYNFSKLRPEGDYVRTTGGAASGPISFMRLFDTMTEVIKQGGIRRGANMGILNSNHPDIEKFVAAKSGNKALKNFNISVMIMPDFWDYFKKEKPYPLANPRTGKITRAISPTMLFDRIVYQAWESAEPGVIFYDHVNKHNPFLKHLGPIVSTNPCGEVLLYPNESCNLGSINIWAFIKTDAGGRKGLDWSALERAVRIATRFLDNVIDINLFPLQAIEEMTLGTRKIGLGLMGLGDLFYGLEIPFNSQKGRSLMEKLAEFINYFSKCESIEIAKKRGPLPFFKKSFYLEGQLPFSGFHDKKSWHFDWSKVANDIKKYGIRNGYTTVIAPTGSLSMISGCSSGIEPVYSLVFEKNVAVGSFYYVDPVFERSMMREGLFDEALIKDVAKNNGSIQRVSYIPPRLKRVFVTAHDIAPEDHIRSLAAFQKWVDSSISKTNNFPADATVDDMRKSYLLAYELGCKDVTVYRDTSIQHQVLVSGEGAKKEKESAGAGKIDELVRIKDEKAEGLTIYKNPAVLEAAASVVPANNGKLTNCPNCATELFFKEGCASCPACGWGLCA